MAEIKWKSKADIDKEKAAYEKQKEIEELKEFLSSTDFYYIRQQETKKPVPSDILQKRVAARNRLNELGL